VPPTSSIDKAYRRDDKVMYWLLVLAVSSCIGATLIYCMPSIMFSYGWNAQQQSLFFTLTSVGCLCGSLVGQQKKPIFFRMSDRTFNGFPVAASGMGLLVVSLVLLEFSTGNALAGHISFVVGVVIGSAGFSLLNTVGGSCLMLTFSEAEKTGMSPFTGAAVAFGKIVSPLVADGAMKLTNGWNSTFSLWLAIAVVTLLLSGIKREAFAKRPKVAESEALQAGP